MKLSKGKRLKPVLGMKSQLALVACACFYLQVNIGFGWGTKLEEGSVSACYSFKSCLDWDRGLQCSLGELLAGSMVEANNLLIVAISRPH